MANDKQKLPSTVTLPTESRKLLENMGSTVERLRADLEVLKKLGLGTSVIEDKLAWADEARKVLLEHFG